MSRTVEELKKLNSSKAKKKKKVNNHEQYDS